MAIFEPKNLFSLTINGITYQSCWESIDITRSMETICGSIAVNTVNFFEESPELWNINIDDEYIADIDGQLISTGYIDDINQNYDTEDHVIEFLGRDRTCALVDCSYYSENNVVSWSAGITVLQLITNLCSIYNIQVFPDKSVSDELNKVLTTDYIIDQGSTVSEEINKICLQHGMLALGITNGQLLLTRAEDFVSTTDIIQENNVISADFTNSHVDRFSKYIVKAQGNEDKFADLLSAYINIEPGIATDDLVRRDRYLVILSEGSGNAELAKKQALYEARTRAGNSKQLTYVMEGWTEVTSGKLWMPNTLVNIVDNKFKFSNVMLLNEVNYTYSDGDGFTSTLNFVHPKKYSAEKVIVEEL